MILGMKTRKKIKKSKKVTVKRGGKQIGEGRTSYVFQPPLKCADGITKYNNVNYVSKLTTKDIAQREFIYSEKLRMIDPDSTFTAIPLYTCEIAEDQSNNDYTKTYKNHLIIMPYAGKPTNTIFSILETAAYKPNKMKSEEIPSLDYINNLLEGLINLAKFVKLMNEKGISHNDIQFDNIMINDNKKPFELRLIDFELSTEYIPEKSRDLFDIINLINEIYDLRNRIYKTENPKLLNKEGKRISRNNYTIDMFNKAMETINIKT